jgi:hypothetical protein
MVQMFPIKIGKTKSRFYRLKRNSLWFYTLKREKAFDSLFTLFDLVPVVATQQSSVQ